MINLEQAQAHQQTINGHDEDWVVSLHGEELYTLPAYVRPEDTFIIRDIISKMMDVARQEGYDSRQEEIDGITKRGQQQLDALAEENVRLATAFEQHILSEEVT